MDNNKCAIYVMSCDATQDVAVHMLKSIEKFWEDVPYDIYLGVNKSLTFLSAVNFPIKLVPSNKSGWKSESLEQIKQIKHADPDITHVLVVLDDFVFNKKVNTSSVRTLIDQAMKSNLPYLMMKETHTGLIEKVGKLFKKRVSGIDYPVLKTPSTHEYYCSLQVALWDIVYLESRIKNCEHIWEFEHNKQDLQPHFAVKTNILSYKHIVEKGEWDFNAKEFCLSNIGYFEPGLRKFRNYKPKSWRILRDKCIIYFFGYQGMNWIRKIIGYVEKR